MKVEVSSSWIEWFSRLKEVDKWLTSLGVKPKSDRFRLHLSSLEAAANAEQRGEIVPYMDKRTPEERRILLWATTEIEELTDVYTAFQTAESAGIRKKLITALSGPALQKEENATNNLARNTMFELSLAARIKRGGFVVEVGQENPDIIVRAFTGTLFVQCKRPLRSKSVPENINGVAAQLRKDIKATPEAAGVIAVSLSKTILERGEFRISTHEQGLSSLALEARTEVAKSRPIWSKLQHPRIVGVLFHFLYPVFVRETAAAMASQTIVHESLPGRRSRLFEHFVKRLPE